MAGSEWEVHRPDRTMTAAPFAETGRGLRNKNNSRCETGWCSAGREEGEEEGEDRL